jgi:hypothetical protein
MAAPEQNVMSLEDIEAKIAALTLLKNQKIAEAEAPKKEKKDKKKGKAIKFDVKVPKVSYPKTAANC